jgi:hypothetical protein
MRYLWICMFFAVAGLLLPGPLRAQSTEFEHWITAWEIDSANADWQGLHELVLQVRHHPKLPASFKVDFYQRSLRFYGNLGIQNDTLLGRTHGFIGLDIYETDLKNAVEHFKRALVHYRRYYPLNDARIHALYFHIAEKLFLDRQIQESVSYLDSAKQYQWSGQKGSNWVRTLNLMARINAFLGDLGRTRLCLVMVRPYIEKLQQNRLHYYLNTQAGMYRDVFLPEEALNLLRPIFQTSADPYYTFSQAGQAFQALHKTDSAIYFFEKQRAILLQERHRFSDTEANWLYNLLAKSYLESGEQVKSLQMLDRMMLEAESESNVLQHLLTRSIVLHRSGQNGPALDICRQIKSGFLNQPDLTPFDQANFFLVYLQQLFGLYQEKMEFSLLREALQLIDEADPFLQTKREQIISPSGRQNFARFYRKFYDVAIKICYQAYSQYADEQHLNRSLQYMESTRALVLAEEFAEKRAEVSLKLKYRLTYERLEQQMGEESDPDARISLSDSIFYWLQKEHREQFNQPDVFSFSQADFDRFKEMPGTMYLNYFQHEDTSLSIVAVGNDRSYFHRIEGKAWYNLVAGELKYFGNYVEEGPGSGHTITSALLPGSLHRLPARLVFIPDGILSYFPFDALTDDNGNPLVEKFGVAYSYSLAMDVQVSQYPAIKGTPVVIAPHFGGGADVASRAHDDRDIPLGPLFFNRQEATGILPYIKQSRLLLDDDATVSNFLTHIYSAPVIHIATHAIASEDDDTKAQIVFSATEKPNAVYLSDIYNRKILSNMIVMSACRTAIGRYLEGEGVMSFARAFTAAGSKSVVATLWPVNDQSTRDIMVNFYRYLSWGWEKDAALQKAKMDYLERADPDYRHPYFWAGFIVIGDRSELVSFPFIHQVGFLLLILAGAGYFFLGKKTKSIPL